MHRARLYAAILFCCPYKIFSPARFCAGYKRSLNQKAYGTRTPLSCSWAIAVEGRLFPQRKSWKIYYETWTQPPPYETSKGLCSTTNDGNLEFMRVQSCVVVFFKSQCPAMASFIWSCKDRNDACLALALAWRGLAGGRSGSKGWTGKLLLSLIPNNI